MKHTHLETYSRLSPGHNKDEMQEKCVLVTGGGHGIGAAIAKSFAEAGVKEIVLVGRQQAKLEATVKDLEAYATNTTVHYRVADISSSEDVKNLFDSLQSSIDILINNAGFLATPENFMDADLSEYWYGFQVNVLGTIQVTQSFLRHREKHGSQQASPALVVTLNTIGAYSVRVPKLSSYGATKAALARWSELISVDVPETTARFISIHPGAVRTEMGIKSGLDGVFPSTDPALAGDFVVWATSDEAKFLAGRFAWVNWDIDELIAAKEEILSKDLLRTSLSE
ncbi:NAD(P)-binding protein [Periconia macrospinosa]|uniref:NAD(P)-binding protein n=1 Tax=Periconia macrospinosa TaxID=97972 RepID=A0A2V1E7B1_9PLEO|nr:NAD(P)-binding protein [Periconia macrospinosa]